MDGKLDMLNTLYPLNLIFCGGAGGRIAKAEGVDNYRDTHIAQIIKNRICEKCFCHGTDYIFSYWALQSGSCAKLALPADASPTKIYFHFIQTCPERQLRRGIEDNSDILFSYFSTDTYVMITHGSQNMFSWRILANYPLIIRFILLIWSSDVHIEKFSKTTAV